MEDSPDWIVRGYHNPEKGELARQMRRAMTPSEKKLWSAVRANRLRGLHIRKQQIIDGFIADFYCHAKRLVIEVDGEVHATRTEADARRSAVFAQHGLHVMRFTNEQIRYAFASCLATIVKYEPPSSPTPEEK